MTSPTPAQETVDRLKPYVLDLLGTSQRDAAATSEVNARASEVAAKTSETNAAGHATQTADDRRQTGEDRTQTGLDRQAAAQSATSAATSANGAATSEDTSLDAAAAAVAAAGAIGAQFQGQGSPNGVVAAPVGSVYTDTAATNGAIRWIKTSGTGNTGWKVEYGDTGWRDVTSLHLEKTSNITFGTSAALLIRRTASLLHIQLRGSLTATSEIALSIDLPLGWRAQTPSSREIMALAGIKSCHVRTTSGNSLLFNGLPLGELLVWQESSTAMIPAQSAWPTAQLGTPA